MPTVLNSEEILNRVAELAADQAGVDRSSVSAQTRFTEDLNYDSLDKVDLVLELEDEFDVNIPDEEAETAKSVGQAANLILSRLGV
jgi:acyl carrier protein